MKTSIRKLILNGHFFVTFPVLGIYLISYLNFELNLTNLLITTLFAWTYWSIAIPKWKLKSVKNLNSNIEYLEWNSRSIWNGLIWPDFSIFSKTEIWSSNEKLEYENIKSNLLNYK